MSWSSVALYTFTGTLTSPKVIAPFQIALIPPVNTSGAVSAYPLPSSSRLDIVCRTIRGSSRPSDTVMTVMTTAAMTPA